MILSEKVTIRINPSNYKYYKNIIEDIKCGIYYEIDVKNLNPTSHVKIDVQCHICCEYSTKPYRDYLKSYNNQGIYCCSPKCALMKNKKTNLEKYGCENSFQSEEVKYKIKETNLRKYGVEYPTQSKDIRDKIKQISLERYGVEYPVKSDKVKDKIKKTCIERYKSSCFLSSEEMKKIRIEVGTKIPEELKTDYESYRDRVRYLTDKIRSDVFENWNGYDFYDGEYIKDNFIYSPGHKMYPTIDHRISIHFGFINKIDPELISDISNICITKRGINSSKNSKCDY
jgi:hypothetical protein